MPDIPEAAVTAAAAAMNEAHAKRGWNKPEPWWVSEVVTAALEAAAPLLTRAESVVTEWGSLDRGTGRVFNCHTAIKDVAASLVTSRKRHGFDDVLVRRTVTYGPWEAVSDSAPAAAVREDEEHG